eukprot:1281878-Amphidinium_carterae.3
MKQIMPRSKIFPLHFLPLGFGIRSLVRIMKYKYNCPAKSKQANCAWQPGWTPGRAQYRVPYGHVQCL